MLRKLVKVQSSLIFLHLRSPICYALNPVSVVVAFLYFIFTIVLRLTALTVIKVCCTFIDLCMCVWFVGNAAVN